MYSTAVKRRGGPVPTKPTFQFATDVEYQHMITSQNFTSLDPRPSPFDPLFAFTIIHGIGRLAKMYYCERKTEGKNGGGLGLSLALVT